MTASTRILRARALAALAGACALTAAVFLPAAPALAMVLPMSPEQGARMAATVAVVQVKPGHARFAAHGIVTSYGLTPVAAVKGTAPSNITIAGGTTGGYTTWVEDQPRLVAGKRYVLFLDSRGRVLGGFQGALTIDAGRVGPRREPLATFLARMRVYGRPPAYWPRLGKPVPVPPAPITVSPASVQRTPAVVLSAGPRIFSISGDEAPCDDNAVIEITGSGFGMTPGTVGFQYDWTYPALGNAPGEIVSWSDSRILVRPRNFIDSTDYAGAAGSGPVTVRRLGGATVAAPTTVSYAYAGDHWPQGVPVPLYVNGDGASGSTADSATAAIQDACLTWSAAGFPLTYAGTTTHASQAQHYAGATNDVFWNSTDQDMSGNTLAVTGASWNIYTGVITDSFTEFNANYDWVTDTPPDSGHFDIQTIATHELGHWMQLGDKYGSGDKPQIMYGYNSGTVKRDLSFAELEACKHVESGDVNPPATVASGVPTQGVPSASITLSGNDTDSASFDIRYRIDDGPVQAYSAPVSIDTSGTHDLAYWGFDEAGNPEVPHHATVFIGSGPIPSGAAPSFTSVAFSGPDRYAVALAASKRAFPAGADSVVLATGVRFPDSLTAASLAGVVNGPVLLVRPTTTLSNDVFNEVKRLIDHNPARHVYIVGGTASVAKGIESQLRYRYGSKVVTRLGGADRYEVANNVAYRLSYECTARSLPSPDGALLASGLTPYDAVLASPVAAYRHWPLLLAGSSLKVSTQDAIANLGLLEIAAIGPTSRLSSTAFNQAAFLVPVAHRRASAVSLSAQSIAVANYGVSIGMTRNGLGFAATAGYNDALTAAPFLGAEGGTAFFLPSKTLDPATKSYLQSHRAQIDTVVFLGGTGSIPNSERAQILSALRP